MSYKIVPTPGDTPEVVMNGWFGMDELSEILDEMREIYDAQFADEEEKET